MFKLKLYIVLKLYLLILQVWWQHAEHLCETSHHAQQVLPAYGNDVSRVLSAMEAAKRVCKAHIIVNITANASVNALLPAGVVKYKGSNQHHCRV